MKRLGIIFTAVIIFGSWQCRADAFWGRGPGSVNGLNVSGFDVNTITTISGKVVTPPERKGRQHTEMSISSDRGTVTVVLGPWWYWEKHAIPFRSNQEVVVTGSFAQGKDGSLYLFAQRLENRGSGESVTLRSESGKPFWSRGGGSN